MRRGPRLDAPASSPPGAGKHRIIARGIRVFSRSPQSFEVFTLTRPTGQGGPVTAAQSICPCAGPVGLQAVGEPAWAPGLP